MSKCTHTMGLNIFSITAEIKCPKYFAISQEFRYNFYNSLFKNARLSSVSVWNFHSFPITDMVFNFCYLTIHYFCLNAMVARDLNVLKILLIPTTTHYPFQEDDFDFHHGSFLSVCCLFISTEACYGASVRGAHSKATSLPGYKVVKNLLQIMPNFCLNMNIKGMM